MFFKKFLSFNQQSKLFSDNDKILLAVSGGIDSMTMMQLFSRVPNNCIVAHCNFNLRNNESDGDELFVREQSEKFNFPCICKSFDTKAYAKENKLSIQMAARELRYNWFRELKKQTQCTCIAVAHSRDDALETFFINLGRGTGIKGLISIQAITEDIIRPLLFATRSDIEKHALEHAIPFREDSSNKSDKYIRNFIRHKIIPSFEEIFPGFRDTIASNISKLNDISQLYDFSMTELIPEIFHRSKNQSYINIPVLLSKPAPKSILFEILTEFGFTPPSISEIFDACYAISGKQFYSPSYKLVKDRDKFILSKFETPHPDKIYIDENTNQITDPIQLSYIQFDKEDDFEVNKSSSTVYLDAEKVTFPLILRKWQQGDYFIPLGMKGMKKLSDFFIDQKMSLFDKDDVWILASGPDIIWIIGKRIDDRFKITDNTRKVLKISYSTDN